MQNRLALPLKVSNRQPHDGFLAPPSGTSQGSGPDSAELPTDIYIRS